MRSPIAPSWSARLTATASSRRCSRRRNTAARCTRSMPSTPRWRACATWRARRCPAKSACNGGATSSIGERGGEASANPVAAALLATIERHQLCAQTLLDLIEAHRFDLYDEPMAGLAELETYAKRTSSALFALAAQILGGGEAEAAAEPAGIAYGDCRRCCARFRSTPRGVSSTCRPTSSSVTGRRPMIFRRPSFGRRSRRRSRNCAISRDSISSRARTNAWRCCRAALPAFLPLALVRPSLDRLERSDAFAPSRNFAVAAAMADLARGARSGADCELARS